MNSIETKIAGNGDTKTGWLEIVRQQIASMRFGVVQIVVHDSQVTQIDKTERVRLERPRAESI